jgi:hypothetical protein
MTPRKAIELLALTVVCGASLRTWFWKGPGFTPIKKIGAAVAFIVFVTISLLILSGH